jgi:uncharacterized protein (DUF305 family)
MDVAAVLSALVIAGCSATMQQPSVAGGEAVRTSASSAAPASPAAQAKADGGVPAYTAADVQFMQGMIGHHGQAIVMAAMAPTHGAESAIRVLAERIDVSQRDEIAFMQRWLGERHQRVPDPAAHHDMAGMAGMVDMPGMSTSGTPEALMPGMLTPEQMKQLDAARGVEFDRLFLTFMIQHHTGALTMVDQLFASPGAGQDVNIFRYASDVSSDQTTEIDRMHTMLASLQPDQP